MIILAIVGVLSVLVAFLGCLIARKLNIPIFILGLFPVGGSLLFWGGASVWIFSPYCTPFDVCDSGGWLAFSVSSAILFIPTLLGNILGLIGYRLLLK